ncbi:hypothetical protein CEXT_696391 [Caerostris extrusa]|uniref:Uncharacterized protein n=1 Tax=Caerostris extrusa TaxID=172846 RepID=A0AAV4YCB6_CAEEX|nr:hypothetical protein CEXT_696391 [Caerostris extrusa]
MLSPTAPGGGGRGTWMCAPRVERAATLERRCALNHKTIESRNRSSPSRISPRQLAAPAAAAKPVFCASRLSILHGAFFRRNTMEENLF